MRWDGMGEEKMGCDVQCKRGDGWVAMQREVR